MISTPRSIRNASCIELRGAGKRYGQYVGVEPLDLRIEAGEFITLLGPSGSGKTTTLAMIAGFVDLTAGEIEIDGKPMSQVPAYKRGIGVVFQHYALFPHMDVEANIAFPLARRNVPRAERRERVKAALEVVRLQGYEGRYPSELSGGQQQRVALARALVFQPGVLLMDEPLGALDRKLRESLHFEIKRIHREVGTTFVYVTHDQEEALVLSDRIAVFHDGRIEQVGTGPELYDRPATLFVGQFIGESTIVRGPIVAEGERSTITAADRQMKAKGRLPANTAGVILLRPEAGYLLPEREKLPDGCNALPVTVVERIYLGSMWKYEIRLPDGSMGYVRQSKDAAHAPEPGDSAHLIWKPDAGVLLADNKSS